MGLLNHKNLIAQIKFTKMFLLKINVIKPFCLLFVKFIHSLKKKKENIMEASLGIE